MVIATPADFVDSAMHRQARLVGIELRLGLLDLEIVFRVAPMLGFLGTVVSVLAVVCRAVHPPDDWTVSSGLSHGIYSGLVPMLLGLGVGLLAELSHRYLQRQADTLSAQLADPELKATLTPGVLGFVERAMERKGRLISLKLDSRLHHLAITASVAPLVGILGTVNSMIGGCPSSFGTSRWTMVAHLTGCLSHALLWTLAGLFIGIVTLVGYRLLAAQADAFKAEISAISAVR